MIKVAVFSDTHRNIGLACEAIRRSRPDVIIHLGDHDSDALTIRDRFPEIAFFGVCGNCDIYPSLPESDIIQLGPVTAFITHGHLYNVKYSIDRLVYAAMEAEASLALFGHTHDAYYDTMNGITVINPGTAGQGRLLTWALLEINDLGGIACKIQDL